MVNAKKELIEILEATHKEKKHIKCAFIHYFKWDFKTKDIKEKEIVLKINYSDEEYETFLKELDFEYDNGYGAQELSGLVWFNDNSWLERGEYDGSEWWEYKKYPKINEKCLK